MICGKSIRVTGIHSRVSHISQYHDTLNLEPLHESVHLLSAKYLLTPAHPKSLLQQIGNYTSSHLNSILNINIQGRNIFAVVE